MGVVGVEASGIVIPTLDKDVWLNGLHQGKRGVGVKHHHGVHASKRCQQPCSICLSMDGPVIAFAQTPHAGVGIDADNQAIAFGRRRFQDGHVSHMEHVEHAVRECDLLALAPPLGDAFQRGV